ncbi:MAG: hypothetical protein A3A28_05830 [Candidatus Sungbacteria bacterium RIFCSPLOWO2_01_FULL_47_32]|uniref:CAAX prenyl protease 2/Lysostaphin resistance protein A-like domain-containing protein n=1 Tax=Candidatus Sungbacteria bacterium RIFCSPHIGHO2_01_FULL_47_32 TaxID=1802264 RepID=A0A1G2K2S1_9BACT|nr:MAG: hypothetical protein UX72_C0004G0008 [Parcubacteria group bacterium GW2011_GWA2_47_10]OGZ93729.1 MAG: hypothetical protein A2633_01465 [Candidatus Sungbacteria bacterium RIFCSPHIGHO2_01_FULL_47_32]OHA06126.1 MAG: hypothetical protein A3A28_05830 [Candidatus Sungbacteria bacterium RIFCSPLOWO2_01_FULL_47_32]
MEYPGSVSEKLWIGLKFGLLNLACMVFAVGPILDLTGISEKLPVIVGPEEPVTFLLFLETVLLAPFIEEAMFRFFPIRICRWLTKNKIILWAVIICASILFGRAHGTWWNVLAQGIGGIILSWAFLRGGYVSSVTAHAVMNSALFLSLIVSQAFGAHASVFLNFVSRFIINALVFLS